ncbi:TPA: baseplate J/gp47 family protein [Escherichia coli]|nr:baseplate J/gp47 family protein [Escherichia coli]HBE6288538.1 baseplate J/gp47 family protein [Escherichia coli]HBE6293111.1 baseplate J/gp47 family protein [Escherichia coli]
MPAVDLSQLPEPAIIAEPDFEAILADTKAMMIAACPAEQREAVSAALELESEPLNVIAQTMSFREMLLRQRVNEGARACMLSHSAGTDLDNLAGNMNTKRLVITPATDTTDAVMESDTSLRLRAQRAYDGLSVAGPSGAYEYFARSASGLVRDARAISPSPANVTVSILSTEGDGTATEALLNTVRAVLNAEDTRPVADRLTVQSARIVTWRLNAKLYFYPGPESEPILAAAESSFRKWLAEQGLIGQDVALSAIAAALHVHGVQRVEIIEPTQNMAISDIQAARCESFTISEGGRNE